MRDSSERAFDNNAKGIALDVGPLRAKDTSVTKSARSVASSLLAIMKHSVHESTN